MGHRRPRTFPLRHPVLLPRRSSRRPRLRYYPALDLSPPGPVVGGLQADGEPAFGGGACGEQGGSRGGAGGGLSGGAAVGGEE